MKRMYLIVSAVIIAIILPIFLWYADEEKGINIAIIDKTVPNESYREHQGITWLLNHLKIKTQDGKPFAPSQDYTGYVPDDQNETYSLRKLPESYSDIDVIYIADTYGVYEEDLPWIEKEREGARSQKVYGGLEDQEWTPIMNRLQQKEKSLLIAEFNTFASPTDAKVREKVTAYLGLDWKGWTGRFFDELSPAQNQEIPQWIVEEYGDAWPYSGPGFLLVNDLTYEIVVLEDNKHITEHGISLTFTDEGEARFGLHTSPQYDYWFDIVTPESGATVLANYEWALTDAGSKLLKDKGIPEQFAAVLSTRHAAASSYYFAGDFNDVRKVPSLYQMKGLPSLYRIAQTYSDQAFYWSTYIPMMQSILSQFEDEPAQAVPKRKEQLTYNARVENNSFEVLEDGIWTPITIKGVNMGMAKPGVFPGEAAITEEEYYRWLEYIGEMNANTIRIYTLHPPGFYNALKRYNESHDKPIYVLHGVWINEESLEETLNAFEPDNLALFQQEMRTMVDVIHGNSLVEAKPGHASGYYQSDVSPYVIGWILGIEWYPFMVEHTNNIHANIGEYEGTYFETKGAKPFEHWLAQQMDHITTYEMQQYHSIRPMSFTNWVTTDILTHPSDSTGQEDIVSVDPNVIYTKRDMNVVNQFASYHIYPYYPDFLNFNKHYLTYTDHRGENNNYAAYLHELHAVHRLPILVAEFGVPGSRGLTHENPFGLNQGFLSEQEQGEILKRLYEDIIHENLLGGLIFTWQDEWFKRTWNTMDYDDPNRRPFWSNAQTNEQQFGLLSFDRHQIQVDGDPAEWSSAPLYKKEDGPLRALYMDHDERYLYIRIDYDPMQKGYPVLMLDVAPNQGNTWVKGKEGLSFEDGIDFLGVFRENEARLTVDAYYDFYNYQYGHKLELISPKNTVRNSGEFTKILYALNKEYYLPEEERIIPFSAYETGKWIKGNANPEAKDYNSLVDYSISKNGVLELRIPWLLIQAKDPSQKEFMGDFYKEGSEASLFVEGIKAGAWFEAEKGEVMDALPASVNGKILPLQTYTWDNWDVPLTKERLKQSYDIVKELFLHYN